jgi:hypothetical protein
METTDEADEDVVAASGSSTEERIRDLERLLGRKTMEVEILKEALDLARAKTDLAVAAAGGYPVKRIAETLGVARSNLVERAAGKRPRRGPETRAGDPELTAVIRRLVDGPQSYGWIPADRRAPQARAASRRPRSRQRQAGLPANEEARPLVNPAYRAARSPSS